MKNCTSDVHTEILTTDFLTVIKDIITSSKVRKVTLCQVLYEEHGFVIIFV